MSRDEGAVETRRAVLRTAGARPLVFEVCLAGSRLARIERAGRSTSGAAVPLVEPARKARRSKPGGLASGAGSPGLETPASGVPAALRR